MSGRLNQPAKRLVKLLIFAFVVHVFVIPQIGGVRKSLSLLGSLNPALIATAVALEAVSFLAYAQLTRLLIRAEHRPGLGISFGTVMASTGINHVVPGGVATTAAVSYRLLGRAGVSTNELAFALGVQGIGSAVVLNVLLWLALVITIPTSGFHPIYGTAAAVGAVLITAFSFTVVAMLRGRDAVANRICSIVGHLPRVDREQVQAAVVAVADQLAVLVADRRRLRMVGSLAATNWLLDAAALWVTLAAFGHRPSIDGLLVAYGLANVIAALPISPGGLGVIEAVLIPTLVGFGTPRAVAAVGVVAYRLANFWLPIPVGVISYAAVEHATATGHGRGFPGEMNHQVSRLRLNPKRGSTGAD